MFRAPQPTPQPPRIPFLSTSDPRAPGYPEGSSYASVNRQVDIPTISIRRWFDTAVPFRVYTTTITMIRGSTTNVHAAPPPTPPAFGFVDTAPRAWQVLQDGSRMFPAQPLLFDPLGGGAFFTTVAPWRTTWPSVDASSILPASPTPSAVVPENQRVFVSLLSYQSPWLQDASMVSAPLVFSSVANPTPVELHRFVSVEPAWKRGPTYPFDGSWFLPPQGPDLVIVPVLGIYIPTFRIRRR